MRLRKGTTMRFKRYIKLMEDTLDTAQGDDNLLAILRIDADDNGPYWEVRVIDTKIDKQYSKKKFRSKEEAIKDFENTKREF